MAKYTYEKQKMDAWDELGFELINPDGKIVERPYFEEMPLWDVCSLLDSETKPLHTEIEMLKAENARLLAKAQALAELRDNLLKQEQAIKDAPDVIAMGMAFAAANGIEREIINLIKGESE